MIDHLMTIDDEPIDQKLYKRMIERSGLVGTLHQHLNASSALDFFSQPDHPPIDVILLDINMPGMNGFEFLEAATAAYGNEFVRYAVVMLSTSTRPEDEARAMAFDVVREFLHKPMTLQHLQEIDQKLLQSKD
ncbi:response regulator [Sagittula sp. S175]|uniref:response regulator n=1 Tax=Sagittula sp. S175 TaxID=3415129 RepID=UPI003C7ABEBB